MRDKLIELVEKAIGEYGKSNIRCFVGNYIADYLLENGVIVVDVNVVPPPNRPLITHCFGRPISEILDIIKAHEKEEAERALKVGVQE